MAIGKNPLQVEYNRKHEARVQNFNRKADGILGDYDMKTGNMDFYSTGTAASNIVDATLDHFRGLMGGEIGSVLDQGDER